MKLFLLPAFVISSFLLSPFPLNAASLNIDTDYRLRGINYVTTQFDKAVSTDSLNYYSQRLQLSINGRFAPGIEIGSRISSLGVVGSTNTVFPTPYPRTDFTPYIENAFIKLSNVADFPVDIIVGKQNLAYGDGLIISDNGTGFNALRLIGRYERPFPWQAEVFTAKVKENFLPESDQDLYGGVGSFTWQKHLFEIGYFEEDDFSGTEYLRGPSNVFETKAIVKQFYDLRISRSDKVSSYKLEIAKQNGYVRRSDNARISMDALGYVVSGELIGEKTRLGKVVAHALVAIFTGNANPLAFENDTSFSPTFTRRFDGLERAGYGELFSATPVDSFFSVPAQYSGIDTLNLGAHFSPLYAWTLGVDYFLYSASQGPKGAPTASGFERLFGAEFTLGVELDLFVKFVHSKYVETRFSYARYTPPKFEVFWPKSDPASRYQLEIAAKF